LVPSALAILLLVAGFRMPGYIASAMAVPLFKHQGFSTKLCLTHTGLAGCVPTDTLAERRYQNGTGRR